jgi:hypothetical protein
MRYLEWAAALVGLSAVVALSTPLVQSSSTAQAGTRQAAPCNVGVYLDSKTFNYKLDQQYPVTLVVTNYCKKKAFTNGSAYIDIPEILVKAVPGCTMLTDSTSGFCRWHIRWLGAGKSLTYHLTIKFSSQDFPGAVAPGTSSHWIQFHVSVSNKTFTGHTPVPVILVG